MKTGRWRLGDTYVVNNSVVGTVQKDAFDRGWWAYGCLVDWQDVKLGLHKTRRAAEKRVEKWLSENE